MNNILGQSEIVEHEVELDAATWPPKLTVTNVRVILWSLQSDRVSEFSRAHLGAIDYRVSRPWIIALLLIFVGLVGGAIFNRYESDKVLVVLLSGVVTAQGFAFLHWKEHVEFWIVGRNHPVEVVRTTWIWQRRQTRLRSLLALIRQSCKSDVIIRQTGPGGCGGGNATDQNCHSSG